MVSYIIYYDESNNHRKLSINNDKLNIDNNPQNKASINFLIAGVAHKRDSKIDTTEWKKNLNLSNDNNDVKFKNLAQGNFIDCLKSPWLTKFLQWLLDKELYIHYYNTNLLYWSFVDIIDDVYSYAVKSNQFNIAGLKLFAPNKTIAYLERFYLDLIKNALYEVIQIDKSKFFTLSNKYNYPNIENNLTGRFIQDIKTLAESYLENKKTYNLPIYTVNGIINLIDFLDMGCDIDELILTSDSETSVLIKNFSNFYSYRSNDFPDSLHIFDEEIQIKNNVENSNQSVEIRFEQSTGNDFIQMSDIISGLVGKYFSYLDENSYQNIIKERKKLNKFQINTLNLLKNLIIKTDKEKSSFLFYISPKMEKIKHQAMLFDIIYKEEDILVIDFCDE